MNALTAPTNIYQDGKLIVCGARLETLDNGQAYWFAGSASGPIQENWTTVEVEVGQTFRHWSFGLVKVVKINRKSMTLISPFAASDGDTRKVAI